MSKGLIKELRQRNVFKVALGYLIASWLVAQVSDLVLESFDAPDWAMRYLLIALAVGFPIALIISWVFEITPKGVVLESQVDRTVKISHESGRRLDFSILLILAIVIIFMGLERFVFSEMGSDPISPENPPDTKPTAGKLDPTPFLPATDAQRGSQTTGNSALPPATPSVAVLPFSVMSSGPDDEYFADGLTEEIINALSQLPDLMVTARTSAFHFKGQNLPIGEIAIQLGVDHVLEGSVRRAGEQLRITAQLVRADDGFHLWSETYDRRTEDTFAVQDDISFKVAEALNLILDDDQRNSMQHAGVRNVDAYIAYQKGVDLYNQAHRDPDQIRLLRQANEHLEDAINHYPAFSDAYIHHSDLFSHILSTTAGGRLDGHITTADIESAADYLRSDFDNAVLYSRDDSQRVMAELDRAVVMGEWRGVNTLSERAMQTPGCKTALWGQLVATPYGNASLARDAFQRSITCDPLQIRGDTHLAHALLWLGDWASAQQFTEQRLSKSPHPWLVRSLAVALTMQGRFEEAEIAIQQHSDDEDDRLMSMAVLTAIQGMGKASKEYAKQLIEGFGPNDQHALRLAAQLGDRNEANRLASQIDRRPFGFLVLLQTIYECACGTPFDLEATPVFASMLQDSGLQWPPVSPITFPLKGW